MERDKMDQIKTDAMDFQARNFNHVQLSVYERIAESEGSHLMEYIRQVDIDDDFIQDWLNVLSSRETDDIENEFIDLIKEEDEVEITEITSEYIDRFYEFVMDNYVSELESYREDEMMNNYPIWNTLFEFKYEPSEDVIQAAIEAGFGVIEPFDEFNTTLFVRGAGYSFIGHHWIPLWLNLPFNKGLREGIGESNREFQHY
jgi:hypothetical protein